MAPRDPPPRPRDPKQPIIPPDPPPDPPPDRRPEPDEEVPASPDEKPATRRDRSRESHPDIEDKRRIPRRSDPPIVISRMSRRFDSSSTHSVGPASLAGYDLLLVHDRQ